MAQATAAQQPRSATQGSHMDTIYQLIRCHASLWTPASTGVFGGGRAGRKRNADNAYILEACYPFASGVFCVILMVMVDTLLLWLMPGNTLDLV
jgi:hypothetical protein